ncbi:putative Beta-3 adrenergic receptor [Quillaja saponaria]|uniref:Beta-3 adrenergic receptor n=1 Tax=Quillaja saponaria TaxID=32244 RepID=A0AAD7L5I7_QUISA|nr:putative Beta-3 adrenergic receptor [Quillaja saponaria]
MSISSWFCTKSTKNLFVKIVHPGGRVELYDRPTLAAEIMSQNRRCCVAHPHVFQEPWAIVAPDTTLMLGQKFYVVPISTIRKLQRLSLKYSPSQIQEIRSIQSIKDGENDGMASTCWIFMNKNSPKLPYTCMKHSSDEEEKVNVESNARDINLNNMDKNSCFSENCFKCLFTEVKIREKSNDLISETQLSSSIASPDTEINRVTRKRTKNFRKNGRRGSPKRLISCENWQPSLHSINEE